jgi:Asp-tRNA(Asn)/Glu-tRNA(Gln) amidotransferase A subunit family amidase
MTPARTFQEAYRAGRATPREVAERALAAIAELDRGPTPLRAFIAVDAADVRAQADASSARWKSGAPRGPLDGVPVGVKDEFDVVGYRTTSGTSFLGERPASRDALAVARLKAAGAVILGKTNMFELGVHPSGLNLTHGTARNPWDLSRDTGGSSSGSGAAVAAGLCPIALGNDGGGSIRIPAALCGVTGLKGTFDRFPTDGVAMLCWSLEHSGPLGVTVEDVRLAFEVSTDEPMTLPTVTRPRLGICRGWWAGADDEVARIVDETLRRLEREGKAELVDVPLPHIDVATAVGTCTFLAEGAAALERWLDADAAFSPSVRLSFESARGVTAPAYVKSQRVRALILRDFVEALDRCDALVSPTTGIAAPPYAPDAIAFGEVDEAKVNALVHFTFPLNLTGLPAASVPAGYTAAGLPVGMQIVTPRGADARALAIAAAVESIVERRRPRTVVNLV